MELMFIKKLSLSFLLFAGFSFLADSAQACSACFFGDPTQKTLVAARWGAIILLTIVFSILALLIKFAINFSKRAKLMMETK